MAINSGSKDRYLEALDFILNVLEEHEKSLDKSLEQFESTLESMGNISALESKISNVEQKIDSLQAETSKLISLIYSQERRGEAPKYSYQEPSRKEADILSGPGVILRYNRWEDFQAKARGSQVLCFSHDEVMHTIEFNAYQGNNILSYTGAYAFLASIIKDWLSQQLNIAKSNVCEGSLTLK